MYLFIVYYFYFFCKIKDKIIDEYYSDLKDDREIKEKTVYKKGDHIFKSVERSEIDYAVSIIIFQTF